MQRKVMLLAAMGILAVATSAALAEKPATKAGGTKDAKAQKAKPDQDLTLTGTISKVEKANKKGEKVMVFVLTDEAGVEASLPKEGLAGVKMEDFVGVKVTLVGKGMKHEGKTGTKIMVHKITSIDKVADAAAAPEAAPAAAPAAAAPAAKAAE